MIETMVTIMRSKALAIKNCIRVIGISLLTILLANCKTLTQEECLSANWEVIGFEDGALGKPSSFVERHQDTCSKFKVEPNLQVYLQGHAQGLNRYCTYQSGMVLAKNGSDYNLVCSANVFREFKKGFERGKNILSVQQQIQQVHSTVNQQANRLTEIDLLTKLKQNQLSEQSLLDEQLRLLKSEINKLQLEKQNLVTEIPYLRKQLVELQKRHDSLEQSNRD